MSHDLVDTVEGLPYQMKVNTHTCLHTHAHHKRSQTHTHIYTDMHKVVHGT